MVFWRFFVGFFWGGRGLGFFGVFLSVTQISFIQNILWNFGKCILEEQMYIGDCVQDLRLYFPLRKYKKCIKFISVFK